MSIEIDLGSEGMKQVQAVLSVLSKLGSTINAVELHSRRREDGDQSNADILNWLADSGRDFATSSSADVEMIAKEATKEIERRVNAEFSKAAVIDRWDAKGRLNELSDFSKELAGAMFIKAMKEYMKQVSRRIDEQDTNAPPFKEKLNESYEKKKKSEVGFAYPIGKKSGQLIDNLNPDGLGARNIRLVRK